MTSVTHLRFVQDSEDGAQVVYTVQSWRRIIRTLLLDRRLATLPCRSDLLLVAYDFSSLCDVNGRGAYSSKERTGTALEDRPDASLCELTEMSKLQVGKMLKLLIALGALRQTRKASRGNQAVYQTTIPTGSDESIGACLAEAAVLGFKPKARRDMTKQAAARRARKAHEEARQVLADAPQAAVDNPVDNEFKGVMQTTPREGHVNDLPKGHADDPLEGRTDDPPLPIGVLGSKGYISSPLGTGPRWAETGAAKDGSRDEAEGVSQARPTIDGKASGNRWGAAVTQAEIRRTGRELMLEERASAPRCQGPDRSGCKHDRPVSRSNGLGLCIRCHGELIRDWDESAPPPLTFEPPAMPPADYRAEGGEHR